MPCDICQDEFPPPSGSTISDEMKDVELPQLDIPEGAQTHRIQCPVCETIYEINLSTFTYTVVE